jgi:hypothetical protein
LILDEAAESGPLVFGNRPRLRFNPFRSWYEAAALAECTTENIQLIASREKVAERKALAHVDSLRDIMDSMSNELAERTLDPAKVAKLISEAGDRARSGAPTKLPPRGSAARPIIDCGERARGRKTESEK